MVNAAGNLSLRFCQTMCLQTGSRLLCRYSASQYRRSRHPRSSFAFGQSRSWHRRTACHQSGRGWPHQDAARHGRPQQPARVSRGMKISFAGSAHEWVRPTLEPQALIVRCNLILPTRRLCRSLRSRGFQAIAPDSNGSPPRPSRSLSTRRSRPVRLRLLSDH